VHWHGDATSAEHTVAVPSKALLCIVARASFPATHAETSGALFSAAALGGRQIASPARHRRAPSSTMTAVATTRLVAQQLRRNAQQLWMA